MPQQGLARLESTGDDSAEAGPATSPTLAQPSPASLPAFLDKVGRVNGIITTSWRLDRGLLVVVVVG